jgi:hypothetical protein
MVSLAPWPKMLSEFFITISTLEGLEVYWQRPSIPKNLHHDLTQCLRVIWSEKG